MNVSILTAFVAGVLSFLSPCILPLVPAYLSYISGVSLQELKTEDSNALVRKAVLINIIAFIIGFSIVFIMLGASATALSSLFRAYKRLIGQIGGIIIIILGLHTMGVIKIPFLNYEARSHINKKGNTFLSQILGSFIMGVAFAFGWSPCIGPILASILYIAAQKQLISQGIFLLLVYSLGLAIPFLLTGLAVNRALSVFSKIKKHFKAIEIVSGLLLIFIGLFIFFGTLGVITNWINKYLPFLNF